jgi:hypothetical protein
MRRIARPVIYEVSQLTPGNVARVLEIATGSHLAYLRRVPFVCQGLDIFGSAGVPFGAAELEKSEVGIFLRKSVRIDG